MEFEDWEPFYEEILDEFGYSREEDRNAARFLDEKLGDFDLSRLETLLRDENVAVVGDAPSLEPPSVPKEGVVIAADGAAELLSEADVKVDVIVTDLDGAPRHAAEASYEGTVVVVHAHGDNLDALERWLPEFDFSNVLGTTQTDARRFDALHNFGGFTDGDRAVFLADEFGAARIVLVGFDFEAAEGEKREKLRWARRLLEYLEEERDEQLV
ncbi:MAG: 6-hydroxymethylpterin diphosphokinase MptE-like protein [Halobacteriales archaeon]|nr:6-hydroxymethylpterin diphosphokinase MptE-like protein [Halobacteriales archaeon]